MPDTTSLAGFSANLIAVRSFAIVRNTHTNQRWYFSLTLDSHSTMPV